MAFHRLAVPSGPRAGENLSADNAFPDRFAVIDIIRRAGASLGLKAPVIATLDALLSCLPPKRGHHVVFASNETLAARLGGLSDRTLRRHFATLQEAGLIRREDSPNRKRFTRRDRVSGLCLRFGFDLRPLFARIADLSARAEAATREHDRVRFLRARLRAAIARALARDPEDPGARACQPALRRVLTSDQLADLLDRVTLDAPPARPLEADAPAARLSASDGHFVRHHQKSKKEPIDRQPEPRSSPAQELSVEQVLEACPDAAAFSPNRPASWRDLIEVGQTLAPMIGVDPRQYDAARRRGGALETALVIWILVSLGERVARPGAYFHALTLGRRSESFDVWRYLARRITHAPASARVDPAGDPGKANCPRTNRGSPPLSADNDPRRCVMTWSAGHSARSDALSMS
ncbi:MAG: replication protein C [Rhodovulum sulfidophilum]|uniref:Replication protein C n=1 Tax=Rhodovulum sulfidophilum TaxID=35806 RepID=A0A2W5N222_RHOSU|nr:MAG: replication protein C [Rhodovulum sulfidophilum]